MLFFIFNLFEGMCKNTQVPKSTNKIAKIYTTILNLVSKAFKHRKKIQIATNFLKPLLPESEILDNILDNTDVEDGEVIS